VSAGLTEADVESLATDWFGSLGYDCATGTEISPDGVRPLRDSVSEPALAVPLRAAITRLNPDCRPPPSTTFCARHCARPTPSLAENNLWPSSS